MSVVTLSASSARRRAATALLAAALAASLAVLLPAVPGADAADAAPEPVTRTVLFRTVDTERAPAAEDTAACQTRLDTQAAGASELTADLFSMAAGTDGAVTAPHRSRIGTGYLCLGSPDPAQAVTEEALGSASFAAVRLRGLGRVTAAGFCALLPAPTGDGRFFANCRLEVDPDRARGILGGVVSSNSLLDLAGTSATATGSVWSAAVQTTRPLPTGTPLAAGSVPAEPGPAEALVVGRGRHSDDDSGYPCLGTRHATALVPVRSDAVSGRVRPLRGTGTTAGVLRTCSTFTDAADVSQVTGQVVVTGPSGAPVALDLQGRCHATGSPQLVRRLVCALLVAPDPADGIQGGLVTTLGSAEVPVSEAGAGDTPLVTVALLPLGG